MIIINWRANTQQQYNECERAQRKNKTIYFRVLIQHGRNQKRAQREGVTILDDNINSN